jgi:hypothetical protein
MKRKDQLNSSIVFSLFRPLLMSCLLLFGASFLSCIPDRDFEWVGDDDDDNNDVNNDESIEPPLGSGNNIYYEGETVSDGSSNYAIIADDAVMVDGIGYFPVDISEGQITFNTDEELNALPVGTVIAGSSDDGGYIVNIDGIAENSNGTITFQTSPATLTDLFKEANVWVMIYDPETPENKLELRRKTMAKLGPMGWAEEYVEIQKTIGDTKEISKTFGPLTATFKIGARGTMTAGAGVDTGWYILDGKLLEFYYRFEGKIWSDTDLDLYSSESYERDFSHDFPEIPLVPLPGIPIFGPISLTIYLQPTAAAEITLESELIGNAGYYLEVPFERGFHWDRGRTTYLNDKIVPIKERREPSWSYSGGAMAKGTLWFKLNVFLNKLAGPVIAFGPYLKAESTVQTSPQMCTLDVKLGLDGYLEFDFGVLGEWFEILDDLKLRYDLIDPDFKVTLYPEDPNENFCPSDSCSDTCGGCCSGESCMSGNSDDYCGRSGETCEQCFGDETCNNNQCVAPDCPAICDWRECDPYNDCICGTCLGDDPCINYQCIPPDCVDVCNSLECGTFSGCNCGSCGTDTCGSYGSCSYSDSCDEAATKSQTCTTYSCDSGSCESSTYTDTASCSRDTDGDSCGTDTCGSYGSCSYSDSCDEAATKSRTCTSYSCDNGSCDSSTYADTASCTRDTDDDSCDSGTGTCTNASCVPNCVSDSYETNDWDWHSFNTDANPYSTCNSSSNPFPFSALVNTISDVDYYQANVKDAIICMADTVITMGNVPSGAQYEMCVRYLGVDWSTSWCSDHDYIMTNTHGDWCCVNVSSGSETIYLDVATSYNDGWLAMRVESIVGSSCSQEYTIDGHF